MDEDRSGEELLLRVEHLVKHYPVDAGGKSTLARTLPRLEERGGRQRIVAAGGLCFGRP